MNEKNSLKKIYSLQNVIYGLGNCFTVFRSQMVSTYRMFFLTTVLLLASSTAGNVVSVASLLCTVMSFLWGVLIQKSNPKMGRLRFWMLLGGIGTAICTFLAFTDFKLTGAAKIIYAFIFFAGTDLFYNMFFTPFLGCTSVLAESTQDRANMQSVKVIFNSLGKVLFGAVNVGIIAFFCNIFNSETAGYTAFAGIIAVLILIGTLLLVRMMKGKETVDASTTDKKEKSLPIGTMLKLTFSKPILLSCGGFLFGKGVTSFIILGCAAYYYKFVAQDMAGLTWYLSVSSILQIAGGVITPYISKKIGLKGTIIAGYVVYIVGLLIAFFAVDNAVITTIALAAGIVGFSFYSAAEVSLYADTIDYVHKTTGIDAKGFLFSLYSAMAPIGTALSSIAIGNGLGMFGFNPEAITDTALFGIRFVMMIVPVICFVIASVCVYLIPTNKEA